MDRPGNPSAFILPVEGAEISAANHRRLFRAATLGRSFRNAIIDSTGIYVRDKPVTTDVDFDLYEIVSAPEYDTTYYEWKATAKPVNPVDGIYTVDTDAAAETIWFPLVPRRDLLSGVTSDQAAQTRLVAYVGERVYVTVRDDDDLEAVTPPLTRWRGELYDDHEPGATSTCYLYYHTGSVYATDTAIKFEAVDVFSQFRGRKRGKYSSPHDSGSFVIAQYMSDSNTFEMEWMTPHAMVIHGQLDSQLTSATAVVDISYVSVIQPTGGILVTSQLDVAETPIDSITVSNALFLKFGAVGAEVFALWNEDDNTWHIFSVEQPAYVARVTLTSAIIDGVATATFNEYYLGQDSGATSVYDEHGEFALAPYGAKGWVVYDDVQDRYVLFHCQIKAHRIRVTLLQDMQSGSPMYATATVNRHYDRVSPGATVTVYDDAGLYSDAKLGASGFAFLDEINNKYVLDTCNQLAFIGRAKVNDGSGTAWNSGTVTVDGIVVLGPTDHSQVPSGVTSMTKLFDWPADNDADILWVRVGTTYLAIPDPPLEQIDVPTNLRYEAGTNHQLQWKKTQNVLVWQADDEDAAWAYWHQLSLDKFVIDTQVTAGNAYQHKETTVYCMEAPVDDSTFDNTWVTGSTC